jgi:signal transduction histidine kinase
MTSPIASDDELLRAGGAAAAVIRHKEQLLTMFVDRVKASLRDARGEPEPMIIDTLPAFLTQIARMLASDDPHGHASECSTIAMQHGDERAKLTDYSLSEVVREYQILRELLLERLASESEIRPVHWNAIHRSIDEAIGSSVVAFTKVHDYFRELFVATLTHDFRGPLGNAHNYLEVMRRAPDHPQREHLALRAMMNLRNIDRMITELLDVTRRRAGQKLSVEPQDCEATELVGGVIAEMSERAGQRIAYDSGPAIPAHWGCDRVRQALRNLLENAIKYSAHDTPITVRTEATHGRVILSVHNFGEAIPREEQLRLFEPYNRSASAQRSGKSGWGLGLAMVQAIAEAHGGSASVESTTERGTTFTLDILQDVRDFKPPRHSVAAEQP